eukprot:3639447-Rhodomonas_salina.2
MQHTEDCNHEKHSGSLEGYLEQHRLHSILKEQNGDDYDDYDGVYCVMNPLAKGCGVIKEREAREGEMIKPAKLLLVVPKPRRTIPDDCFPLARNVLPYQFCHIGVLQSYPGTLPGVSAESGKPLRGRSGDFQLSPYAVASTPLR